MKAKQNMNMKHTITNTMFVMKTPMHMRQITVKCMKAENAANGMWEKRVMRGGVTTIITASGIIMAQSVTKKEIKYAVDV